MCVSVFSLFVFFGAWHHVELSCTWLFRFLLRVLGFEALDEMLRVWEGGVRASGRQGVRASGRQGVRASARQGVRESGSQGWRCLMVGPATDLASGCHGLGFGLGRQQTCVVASWKRS